MRQVFFCAKRKQTRIKPSKKYTKHRNAKNQLTKSGGGDIIIKLSNERAKRERVKKFFKKST